jgi:hypothetical protein
MEPGDSFVDSSFVFDQTRSDIMARWRQAVELAMTAEEIGRLTGIARSRSEAARLANRTKIHCAACRFSSLPPPGAKRFKVL